MPRLHQGTCCPETCIPDEQLVSGYIHVDGYMLLVRDTCRLYLGNIITTVFISVTVDLYPFVSMNATNRIHIDGDKWIQVWIQLVSGNMYPSVNVA